MRPRPLRAAASLLFAAAGALALGGCCNPKGQFELTATVVDGPTGQLIPLPGFGGDAAYAKCVTHFGDQNGGMGGGTQSMGPCRSWLVYADENGGTIKVTAAGYASQSFQVPKSNEDACGPPDTATKTFRLQRTN
ncbi:MAG TPA: hypothetical protein VHB21_14350 [Minicystis sp.]|nr:hypothetical protein [Minicystis sp.]